MTEHEDDGPVLPEGFEKVEATVCRKGEELIVFGALEEGPFVFHLRLARKEEDFGPAPPGSRPGCVPDSPPRLIISSESVREVELRSSSAVSRSARVSLPSAMRARTLRIESSVCSSSTRG